MQKLTATITVEVDPEIDEQQALRFADDVVMHFMKLGMMTKISKDKSLRKSVMTFIREGAQETS